VAKGAAHQQPERKKPGRKFKAESTDADAAAADSAQPSLQRESTELVTAEVDAAPAARKRGRKPGRQSGSAARDSRTSQQIKAEATDDDGSNHADVPPAKKAKAKKGGAVRKAAPAFPDLQPERNGDKLRSSKNTLPPGPLDKLIDKLENGLVDSDDEMADATTDGDNTQATAASEDSLAMLPWTQGLAVTTVATSERMAELTPAVPDVEADLECAHRFGAVWLPILTKTGAFYRRGAVP
jgi:hypothetical protein